MCTALAFELHARQPSQRAPRQKQTHTQKTRASLQTICAYRRREHSATRPHLAASMWPPCLARATAASAAVPEPTRALVTTAQTSTGVRDASPAEIGDQGDLRCMLAPPHIIPQRTPS